MVIGSHGVVIFHGCPQFNFFLTKSCQITILIKSESGPKEGKQFGLKIFFDPNYFWVPKIVWSKEV